MNGYYFNLYLFQILSFTRFINLKHTYTPFLFLSTTSPILLHLLIAYALLLVPTFISHFYITALNMYLYLTLSLFFL